MPRHIEDLAFVDVLVSKGWDRQPCPLCRTTDAATTAGDPPGVASWVCLGCGLFLLTEDGAKALEGLRDQDLHRWAALCVRVKHHLDGWSNQPITAAMILPLDQPTTR